jgi:hypothetical protein
MFHGEALEPDSLLDALEFRVGSLRKMQVVVSVTVVQPAHGSRPPQSEVGIFMHWLEQPIASLLGLHQRSADEAIQSV